MVFFDLTFSVKSKIMEALRQCFSRNQHYENVHITDNFPFENKKLPAIIVQNASTPMERAGAEDYIKDITTPTGEVLETFRLGNSIKSIYRRPDRSLFCIEKPEVFRFDILENNQLTITRSNPLSRFGPITVVPGSVLKDLINNVDIELDEQLKEGDTVVVLVMPIGGAVAKLYGGLFEMELSLTVLADSNHQRQSITDWAAMYIRFVKKPDLERDLNIIIKDVRLTGEAEIQEAKDYIYTAGIDISLRSQWAYPVPISMTGKYVTAIETLTSQFETKTCQGIPVAIID